MVSMMFLKIIKLKINVIVGMCLKKMTLINQSFIMMSRNNKKVEIETEPFEHLLSNYQLARDRVRRELKKLMRFAEAYLIHCTAGEEPYNNEASKYIEVVTSKDAKKWIMAMNEGYQSLIKNCTWVVVSKPHGAKAVRCRWLYKLKDGVEKVELTKYKAIFIA